MNQTSFPILVIAVLLAIGMQMYSVAKIITSIRRKKGTIRSRLDLSEVKEVINVNMKLAVLYIILHVVFFIFIVLMVDFSQAILTIFLFGIITLPVGLIGKHYENKIKSLKIESDDKEIKRIFDTYLVEWKQARWKLSD